MRILPKKAVPRNPGKIPAKPRESREKVPRGSLKKQPEKAEKKTKKDPKCQYKETGTTNGSRHPALWERYLD